MGERAEWGPARLSAASSRDFTPTRSPLPLASESVHAATPKAAVPAGSVVEGVRKYQNPALANLMQGVLGENSANRDRLRQYVQDLAAQKEQEFAVADKEAQRCRATLMRQQAPPGRKNQN